MTLLCNLLPLQIVITTMKRNLTLILLVISLMGFSQQEPQFYMFWNNYSMFNPANTGLHYNHFGNMVYRTQRVGIEKQPITFTGIYGTKHEFVLAVLIK